MMNGTVLDILIYVFDRYMFDEAPEVPEREALARDLESAGFGEANVERALDWLADLAGERQPRAAACPRPDADDARRSARRSLRLYSHAWSWRASRRIAAACCCRWSRRRSCMPAQRELVIDRLLALDVEDLNLEQVRWVVLMVLSSQPGQEQACARMETLVFDADTGATH